MLSYFGNIWFYDFEDFSHNRKTHFQVFLDSPLIFYTWNSNESEVGSVRKGSYLSGRMLTDRLEARNKFKLLFQLLYLLLEDISLMFSINGLLLQFKNNNRNSRFSDDYG